jgi:hypothetical protein
VRRLLGGLALLAALLACAAPSASAGTFETEREAALALGVEAYEYAEPLLDSVRIYKSITSVKVPTDFGSAPFNQFSHFKALATEKEGCVVAPNADTLYSIAVLKLKSQAVVMHVPATDRFSIAELLSPYTENFALIGQGGSNFLAPGDYIIAGPGQFEGLEEADGLKVVHSPYNEAWVIGRTLVKDQADVPNALAVEEARKIIPLKKWLRVGDAYEPKASGGPVVEGKCLTVPGTTGGSTAPYWKAVSKALVQFPPPAADEPILERLAAVHIGPGMSPSKSNDSPGTLAGLEQAVASGPVAVKLDARAALEAGFAAHNGWLVGAAGKYGTNYKLRALADRLGVGAPTPNQAIYPLALTDRNLSPLNAESTRYVAHFPASDFPVPVESFWSLTMYDGEGLFVPNALNRFALGDRSEMHFNEDGSLDVYLQTAEPANEAQRANWLPAPAGPFRLIIRLYGPFEEAIPQILAGGEGAWTPPTVLPCLAGGKTAAGTNCAE